MDHSDWFTWNGKAIPKQKKPIKRGAKKAKQPCDFVKRSITTAEPGSEERLRAFRDHYEVQMVMGFEESPFNV